MTRLPDGRWNIGEKLFWAFAAGSYFLFPDYRALGSHVLVTALFALSLDLILGYAGIVSLGHAAFFGLGAYGAGVLAARGWGEPISGLLAAGVLAGVTGYVVSFLVIRAGDLARMMITLGVASLLYEAANQMPWLTGGANGLQGAITDPVLGLFEFDIFGRTAYVYSLLVLFAAFVLVRRLVNAPAGLVLTGIRGNAARMQALGVPVAARLRFAFAAGAALAGVAGALLAQTTQFVGLDVFGIGRSADALTMLVLGGAGWLYGGLLGAAGFLLVHDLLSSLNPVYWQFWMGILLIAVVLLARGGLGGAGKKLIAAYQARSGK
ncbi:MAG TPA: branched-chain amino acid ABC transporter permease [Steroidobacteraceae bacterium]|jgi:branched-chain amino acid transport system permease protein